MIPTETPLQTEVAESWKPHRRTDQRLRRGGVAYRERSSIALIERTKTFSLCYFRSANLWNKFSNGPAPPSVNRVKRYRVLSSFMQFRESFLPLPSTIRFLSIRIYDVCWDGRSILFSRRRRSSSLAFHDLPSSFHLVENKKDPEKAR